VPPDGAATRRRLIEATADVVRDVGYAGATTKAIAQAAGVSEGTIYRHFSHKHELFLAAVMAPNEEAVQWLVALPSLAGTRTLEENLREAMQRLASLRHDIAPLELAMRADPMLAREHAALMAKRLSEVGPPVDPPAALAAYLAAEQGLGRVRSDVGAMPLAMVLLSMIAGLSMGPLPESHFDAALGTAVTVMLKGLVVGSD
jgi:AcrR family transcriptional regulator